MTLLIADGLDSGLTRSRYTFGSPTWNPTGGVYGGGCLELPANVNDGTHYITYYLYPDDYVDTSNPITRVSFWFKTSATVTNESFFFVIGDQRGLTGWFGGNSIWTDGRFTNFMYGTGWNQQTYRPTAYGRLDDGKWHHVETGWKFHNSTGYFQISIDGVLYGTWTPLDMIWSPWYGDYTPSLVDWISFRNGRNAVISIDDVVVWNEYNTGDNFSNRIGPTRIYTVRPSADTVQANSVPSSGSDRYLMINEPVANTANYVTMPVAGQDLYSISPVANVDGPILGATATLNFSSAYSGYGANVRTVVVSNGVSYRSNTTTSITLTPKITTTFFTKNFGKGNTLWTLSDINSINVGFEVIT